MDEQKKRRREERKKSHLRRPPSAQAINSREFGSRVRDRRAGGERDEMEYGRREEEGERGGGTHLAAFLREGGCCKVLF